MGPVGVRGEEGGPTHLLSSSILRNGAFSLATGKEESTHQPPVCSSAGLARHTQEVPKGLSELEHVLPKVHLFLWET